MFGRAYLTNGEVAWEIPEGRIAHFYLWGAYLPPEGWRVEEAYSVMRWNRGICGELRREKIKDTVPA